MGSEGEMKLSKFGRICVFCGSSQGKKSSYQDAAIELGKELVLFLQPFCQNVFFLVCKVLFFVSFCIFVLFLDSCLKKMRFWHMGFLMEAFLL